MNKYFKVERIPAPGASLLPEMEKLNEVQQALIQRMHESIQYKLIEILKKETGYDSLDHPRVKEALLIREITTSSSRYEVQWHNRQIAEISLGEINPFASTGEFIKSLGFEVRPI